MKNNELSNKEIIRENTPEFTTKLTKIFNSLKPGEEITINSNGTISVIGVNKKGNLVNNKVGNLHYNDEEVAKLSSPIPYAGAAKKSFYGMENKPQNHRLPAISLLNVGMYNLYLGTNPKAVEKYTLIKLHGVNYRAVKVNIFTGYYNNAGRLSLIHDGNEMFVLPPQFSEMVTEIMSYCDDCGLVYRQNQVKLYRNGIENYNYCINCASNKENIVEIIIK